MTFLSAHEMRSLNLLDSRGLRPVGLFLGQGHSALEVAVTAAGRRPRGSTLKRVWRDRQGGRAAPLLLVALYDGKAAMCGPGGDRPPTYLDLDAGLVERLCSAALSQPNRNAALRYLRSVLPQVESRIPGLGNQGFFATHELEKGAPGRGDWHEAVRKAQPLLAMRGERLVRALGYEIQPLPGPTSVLRAGPRKIALAIFLDRTEATDVPSPRFSERSPISYALARADAESLRYVFVTSDSILRIYPTESGVGTGRGGRTETFVQLDLDLLRDDQAGYLWLVFSAGALLPRGTFSDILARSEDYAADLGTRLRDRIHVRLRSWPSRCLFRVKGLTNRNR